MRALPDRDNADCRNSGVGVLNGLLVERCRDHSGQHGRAAGDSRRGGRAAVRQAVPRGKGGEDVGHVACDARGQPGANRAAAGEQSQSDAMDGDLACPEAAQGDRRRGPSRARAEPAVARDLAGGYDQRDPVGDPEPENRCGDGASTGHDVDKPRPPRGRAGRSARPTGATSNNPRMARETQEIDVHALGTVTFRPLGKVQMERLQEAAKRSSISPFGEKASTHEIEDALLVTQHMVTPKFASDAELFAALDGHDHVISDVAHAIRDASWPHQPKG
jgi:hypothetical protein